MQGETQCVPLKYIDNKRTKMLNTMRLTTIYGEESPKKEDGKGGREPFW